jgi:MoaA/NifB/PqqE/SkfB family radical SAM enzyme
MYTNIDPSMVTGFMDLDQFNRIVDRLTPLIARAGTFQFSTNEPLFHKDIFVMMDKIATINSRIEMPLLSNGLLLNERRIDELLKRNVHSVTISLDGCHKDVVEQFKTGSQFDRIVDNIRLLRKKAPRMVLNTVFVATRDNYKTIEEYVDFCADLGVNSIMVNGFLSFSREMAHLYLYSPQGNDSAKRCFQKAMLKAKQRNLCIALPSLIPKRIGCNLSSHMFVKDNGDVSPCVLLAYPTTLEWFGEFSRTRFVSFGNVLGEDPIQIWRKPKYVAFRNKLTPKSPIIPQECVFCADAYGVICSNRSPII